MAYTLPTVRGLVIHMEDKQTTILMPRNRYDQVIKLLSQVNILQLFSFTFEVFSPPTFLFDRLFEL